MVDDARDRAPALRPLTASNVRLNNVLPLLTVCSAAVVQSCGTAPGAAATVPQATARAPRPAVAPPGPDDPFERSARESDWLLIRDRTDDDGNLWRTYRSKTTGREEEFCFPLCKSGSGLWCGMDPQTGAIVSIGEITYPPEPDAEGSTQQTVGQGATE
jgi:hypothetical protein